MHAPIAVSHHPGAADAGGAAEVLSGHVNGVRSGVLAGDVGDEVGVLFDRPWMPAGELGGRQYLVVSVSGGAYSGELLALRLPS